MTDEEINYSKKYIYICTNETIQKTSKFCATNGFMLQNNHQARKITLKNIKHSSININYNLTCKFKNFFTFILLTKLPHVKSIKIFKQF